MEISAFSPASIWNATVRTLTGLGAGAFAASQGINIAFAATSTSTFVSGGAQKVAQYSIGVIANAGGTILIQFTDGTNTVTVTTVAISTGGVQDVAVNSAGVFWQVHNNSATSAILFYAGQIFGQ